MYQTTLTIILTQITNMSKIKSFTNWRAGALKLDFPNGNSISTTFASGSYSDNYNLSLDKWNEPLGKDNIITSNTCEMMVSCGDKLHKRLERKFDCENIGVFPHMTIENWLYITNKVSKENY